MARCEFGSPVTPDVVDGTAAGQFNATNLCHAKPVLARNHGGLQ